MAKFNTAINSFIAGEISPKISGRSDVQQFNQSCEELKNMIVWPQGGAYRRAGSKSLAISSYFFGVSRLIKFKATDGTFTFIIASTGFGGITSWFTWDGVSSTFTPLYVKPGYAHKILTPGPSTLQVAQNGDVLVIVDKACPPIKIIYKNSRFQAMYLWDEPTNGVKTATISIASPAVVTCASHGRANGERVEFATTGALPTGILTVTPFGASTPSPYYIKNVTANTFEISLTSGGASINTSGTQSGVHSVGFFDNANVDIYQAWKRRAYSTPNIADVFGKGTVTPSATTGTWSGNGTGVLLTGGYFFAALVGTYIKISDPSAGTKTGAIYIQEYISATQVRGTVVSTLPGTSAYGGIGSPTTSWETEAFISENGVEGYPASACFYQQRLLLTRKDTIYFSQIGDIYEFMARPFEQDADFSTYTSNNSLAFSTAIAASETPYINWISPNKSLLVGTDAREYACLTEGTLGNATPPSFVAQTSYGTTYLPPARKDSYAIFADSGGKLRDLQFSFQEDAWKSDELTLLADHMLYKNDVAIGDDTSSSVASSITALELSRKNDLLFFHSTLGGLIAVTLKKDAAILALSSFLFGGIGPGEFYDGEDPSAVLSETVPRIASVVEKDGTLFLIVNRLNPETNTHYCSFESIDIEDGIINSSRDAVYKNMCFLDCSFSSGSVTAKTNWSTADSGLSNITYIEGQTVRVFADGFDRGNVVVTAGSITLPAAAYKIRIGFPYESKLITNYTNPGSPIGSSQGLTKKIDQVVVRFYRTIYAEVGNKEKVDSIVFRESTVPGDTVTPTFTGDKIINPSALYDREGKVVIQSSAPYPMNVVSVTVRGATYD